MRPQWICCQIGAREHYAVTRALHRADRLFGLYTDFWADSLTRKVVAKMGNRTLRSLATRFHSQLAGRPESGFRNCAAKVHSWNLRSLAWEWRLRHESKTRGTEGAYLGFIEVGRRFAVCVREALKRRSDLGPGAIFFGYDTGALEAMEWCRDRGIKCVLNQMDPNRVEVEIVRAEERSWPGWALKATRVPEEYFIRREREWALADRVVVNSEFSRQALLQQGVPAEKLVVIPLCYEPDEQRGGAGEGFDAASGAAPAQLRVLFLGQVLLRKGIQYLIAAARILEKENLHFNVVGPLGISAEAVASAPANMTFHGRVPRDQIAAWYQKSDVFVLPTLSDGFAITQLEAMSYGLPVVATSSCGEVVSDGSDGFVIPARDTGAIFRVFQQYLSEPGLLRRQRQAAVAKSKQFAMERLVANLISLETDVLAGRMPATTT